MFAVQNSDESTVNPTVPTWLLLQTAVLPFDGGISSGRIARCAVTTASRRDVLALSWEITGDSTAWFDKVTRFYEDGPRLIQIGNHDQQIQWIIW